MKPIYHRSNNSKSSTYMHYHKEICGFIILFFLATGNMSAEKIKNDNKSGVIVCTDFHVTRPLREIVAEHPVDRNKIYKKSESEDRENRNPQKFLYSVADGSQYGNDPAGIQRTMGNVPAMVPITNWPGQSVGGFRPWDPSGAAGPNHYVQIINSTTFEVYDKTSGAGMLTATLGDLWTPATPNDGDPILLYDKAADRWFMSQFGNTGNSIYIAISVTGDPTGSYYTYTFTSPAFPDYLKFSVWSDGYYMTSNQAQKVFCFDRAAMLAGTPSARSIYTSFSPPNGTGFFVPLSADASDGVLPPPGTPCPIFSYSDNGWGPGFSDAVNIYQMSVNWTPVTPTGVITLAANIPTAAFDATYASSWNDVSQPGTTQKLDGIGGVCMFRAQWKSFNGYNTTVLNWAVQISSTQRSIKWCELRQDQISGVWSMYQEGIYTPDVATRWMGGIAMDNNGSIALCYMKSDATSIYPGLYYTGRRVCDPLGTLPITETAVVAGTGSQTNGNRDGDYATLALDPDGVTFWHTSEYMGGPTGSSATRTQIFSFQLPSCSNIASVYISQTAGSNPQCPGVPATFTAIPYNGGTAPSYQWQMNGINVGTNSSTYSTSSVSNGQVVTCIMTSNLGGVTGNPATSTNAITMIVNPVITPAVSVALTTGHNPTCAGSSVIFTASPTNGGTAPSYQWQVDGINVGTNSTTFSTSTLTDGQVVSCVLTSNVLCVTSSTASSNGITMTVNPIVNPSVTISQTAGSNPQCAGDSSAFTAVILNGTAQSYQWKVDGTNTGLNSSTFTTLLTNGQTVSCDIVGTAACSAVVFHTLGTGTSTNSSSGNSANSGAAYPTYYGNGRQQYLVLASELTALGFAAGNITSLAFNVANTTGDPLTLNGYTIKIGATASTVMTTAFLTFPFTTVFGPANYTPTVNALNTHPFSTPFAWNGTSNIVIDICFSDQVNGNAAYQNYYTTATFVSTAYYQVDGTAGASACSHVNGSRTTSRRPNMTFTIGSNTQSLASSNIITMSVNATLTPAVSISLTTGSNPTCLGSPATFTAAPVGGGFTPSYQWQVNGVNAGTGNSAFTTSSLTNGQTVSCVMTSNASCANPLNATSSGIAMAVDSPVTPSVSINLSSGTNPECPGSEATFTASVVNGGVGPSYQWKNGITFVGTNNPNYSTSTLSDGDVITCSMTSSAYCVTASLVASNPLTMSVYPPISSAISQHGDTLITAAGYSLYQWYIDTTAITGATDTFYIANQSGNYSVMITDSNGCTSRNQITVVITSVHETQAFIRDFTVLYNSGNLFIELNSALTTTSSIQLTDALGRYLFQKMILLSNGKNEIEIPALNLPAGIYIIKVVNSYQAVTKKIFIR